MRSGLDDVLAHQDHNSGIDSPRQCVIQMIFTLLPQSSVTLVSIRLISGYCASDLKGKDNFPMRAPVYPPLSEEDKTVLKRWLDQGWSAYRVIVNGRSTLRLVKPPTVSFRPRSIRASKPLVERDTK